MRNKTSCAKNLRPRSTSNKHNNFWTQPHKCQSVCPHNRRPSKTIPTLCVMRYLGRVAVSIRHDRTWGLQNATDHIPKLTRTPLKPSKQAAQSLPEEADAAIPKFEQHYSRCRVSRPGKQTRRNRAGRGRWRCCPAAQDRAVDPPTLQPPRRRRRSTWP